ncbi:MAG: hypothetical protein PVH82_07550, partial [Desulfobacteraceae bacterium]
DFEICRKLSKVVKKCRQWARSLPSNFSMPRDFSYLQDKTHKKTTGRLPMRFVLFPTLAEGKCFGGHLAKAEEQH